MLERGVLTASLAMFFVASYFGVGLSRNPAQAYELTTRLDVRIPFIASSVWIYLWVFPCILFPLFVVRCHRLFRRTAMAYAVVIGVSFIFFAAFPVTSSRLRIAQEVLDVSYPSHWVIESLYWIDPPYNLFPSLHISMATLAAFSTWKAARPYGLAMFVSLGLLCISVGTVKQHFLADVFGGLALAAVTAMPLLLSYQPPDGVTPARSWRGPASYVGFVLIFYAGIYAAFLGGL